MEHTWLLNKKIKLNWNKIKQANYNENITFRNIKHFKVDLARIQVWCSVTLRRWTVGSWHLKGLWFVKQSTDLLDSRRWRHCILSESQEPLTQWHGVMSQIWIHASCCFDSLSTVKTPWSIVCLERLSVPSWLHVWSQVVTIHTLSSYLRPILILSTHLYLCLPSMLSLSVSVSVKVYKLKFLYVVLCLA